VGLKPVPIKEDENPNNIIDEIRKPSKGDELINSLNEKKLKEKEDKLIIEKEEKKDDFIGTVKDGVEVVDVKIIPNKEKNKQVTDKFGIPVSKNRDWDKI